MDNKEVFITLLKTVNRPGIEELITWLNNSTDFFTAPASPKLFKNYSGGLCEKALIRYDQAKNINETNNLNMNKDSLIITTLLADINNVNRFKLSSFNKKHYNSNGRLSDSLGRFDWVENLDYIVVPDEERFIFGTSGQNSERLVSNYIPLTDEESSAIINMGVTYENPTFYYGGIYKKYPLAALLNAADILATFVIKEVLPF